MDPELPKILTHSVHVSKVLMADIDQALQNLAALKASLGSAVDALSGSHAVVQTAKPEEADAAIAATPLVEPAPVQVSDADTVKKPIKKADA